MGLMRAANSCVTVSVVIPAYNAAVYIAEALDSVIAQTYQPIEILVVDDGSTDDTVRLVSSYECVTLFEQEHRGVSATRNLGIDRAKGEFIAFLDADDLWKPKKLEKQIECILEKGVAWVSCGVIFFDNRTKLPLPGYQKQLFEGDILEQEYLYSFILSPSPIVKRSVFDEVGLFNENIRIGEDWDMWLRIAARYPLGVVHEELAFKREHHQSTMEKTLIEEKLNEQLRILETAVMREPERLAPLKNQLISRIYLDYGIAHVKRGNYQEARSFLTQAHHYSPGSLKLAGYRLVLSMGDQIAASLSGFVRGIRKLPW